MPCECDIVFHNNPDGVFYSGQIVSGTAIVNMKKSKTIKGIHIIVKGYAKVNWRQGQFRLFDDQRLYIGIQIYLCGSENAKTFELESGIHKYPFQFRLADNLPSTIKTNCGRINYDLLLTVVNPLAINKVFSKSIAVEYPLDLNSDPAFQKPICRTAQCSSCFNIFRPQLIRIQLNTETTGFQIGQPLKFCLRVENDSTFGVDICFKLRKIITHIAGEDRIKLRGTIAEKTVGHVSKTSVREFDDQIDVPVTESSSMATCDIMKTSYHIQIIVRTPRFHEDLISNVPIVLGVVPIGGNIVDVTSFLDTPL